MGAHRVEDVFTCTDINGLLERDQKLGGEVEEERAGADWSCGRPNDGCGAYNVGLGVAFFRCSQDPKIVLSSGTRTQYKNDIRHLDLAMQHLRSDGTNIRFNAIL